MPTWNSLPAKLSNIPITVVLWTIKTKMTNRNTRPASNCKAQDSAHFLGATKLDIVR
jgi:hypothetical protein